MIYYQNTDNLKKIAIPRSLKPCIGLENSATYHENEIGVITMKENTNIAKRANEIITNEITTTNKIIIKTKN